MATSSKPSLRFFHSTSLRARTNKVLSGIERDEDPTEHGEALSSLVVDLTEAGFTYYCLKPLEQAKVGFVARQTASLGMAGALRMMSPVIRNILGGADAKQLRAITRHIRQLM